jgi:hypothetical protein
VSRLFVVVRVIERAAAMRIEIDLLDALKTV